jgi:hypothetical protein
MADNIQIVGNILAANTVSRYNTKDTKLIPSSIIKENFGGENDYIEFYIYDAGNNLLNIDYNYLDYHLPYSTGLTPGITTQPNTTGNIQTENVGIDSTLASQTSSLYPIIEIDPIVDLQNSGYTSGEFKVRYNIFQNKISNFFDTALYVKEISTDRTELRLASITLTNDEIESATLSLIDKINSSSYYVDYLLNFGQNKQAVAINIALNKASEGYEVLAKLYEPLPTEAQEKDELWIVEEKASPYLFDINLDKFIIPPPPPTLRGPNFDIIIPNQNTVSTAYIDYSTAISSLQLLQNTSYHQILNLMNTQSIQINVDYTDFDNFVFFGSAYSRIRNFHSKVQQIEAYNTLISNYTPYVATTASLQTEINTYSSSINTLISQFDGYESYLYFESSSYAWPKSGSFKPYELLPISSPTVTTWYNALTASALIYDNDNYDNLKYAVPNFLKDDENNQPYFVFLSMLGQYFDNIWIYLKAITDINLANNNLNVGISKDLVYNQLQSLGIKLYNSQAGESVDQYLIGANTGSSIFNNDFSITGSYLNNIPRKDLVSELYKRIYHNLPLLLKTKGTVAGLDNLMTVFGIPNKTYYTVGSESFYTPTGSSATASILNVKEFGGGTKAGLIDGYNNDKTRIIPNTVYGNVLSPLLSLQTYPTASTQFRENDMHYVDISFSPQSQIDTYVSGAISSNNPTWSLDDYIGDPRQQYSSSYPDLNAQRKLYFETGVSGFAPFTASALDYNGFIRLIEFFDNSLFKMLEDFTPERTSLSTGVTINSPVLERNKVVYSVPQVYTQSILTAQYSASTISSPYGTLYSQLQGNKKPYFTGELSGSVVDVHQYFTDNYNPYLGNWNVWNAQHPPTQSIDQNTFLHSDWNVLLNNISKSVQSNVRQNIEYVWGTTGSILKPAELQDSYLTLRSYNISRYEGSKTNSQLYNTYTEGDDSFGKTAAIDHTVRKIGIFTQIESSSYLPKRNTVALKYLVDEFGGLTELNRSNKNWWEIQRTLIMGDTASVSLFDNKKYSNQKATDGEKLIFDSGYTYAPILYGSGSDTRLYFQNVTSDASYYAQASNLRSNFYISGSPNPSFPVVGGYVQNLFNNIISNDGYLYGGTGSAFPSYSISEGGGWSINATFDITVTMQGAESASFNLQAFTGSTILDGDEQSFVFSSTTLTGIPWTGYLTTTAGTITGTPITSVRPIIIAGVTKPAGTQFYYYSGLYKTNTACSLSDLLSPGYSLLSSIALQNDPSCTGIKTTKNPVYEISDFNIPEAGVPLTKTFNISIPSQTFLSGSKIQLSLSQSLLSTNNYTASITPGNFTIRSLTTSVGNYPYIAQTTAGDGYFSTAMNEYGSSSPCYVTDELTFSTALANFYSSNYQFLPTYVSSSTVYSNSLYSTYGDVDYSFQLNPMDIFVAYDMSGNYFESRVVSVYRDTTCGGFLRVKLADNIPSPLKFQLAPGDSGITSRNYKFLFLKRVDDETNAYLTFQKRPGFTSYGFLIPQNLAKDILDNIDTITKEVKQKLLADQQGTI